MQFLPIQILVILQVSCSIGKPTRDPHFYSTTDQPLIDVTEADIETDDNSSALSFVETLSISLVVFPENQTLAESSSTSLFISANFSAPTDAAANSSSTSEPDYLDDHNSTSSTSSEFDDVLDPMSIHLESSSAEVSSSSPLITLDEMEAVGTLDDTVTATAPSPEYLEQFSRSVSQNTSASNISKLSATSSSLSFAGDIGDNDNGSRNAKAVDEDDIIILASKTSNRNTDNVESLDSQSPIARRMLLLNADEMQTGVITSSSSEPLVETYTTSLVDEVEDVPVQN